MMNTKIKQIPVITRMVLTFSLCIFLGFNNSGLKAQDTAKKEETQLTKEDAVKNLDSSAPKTQIKALKYIGKEKVTDALPKVGNLLATSSDYLVRGEAAKTLSMLGEKEKAHPFLDKAVKSDSDSYVRYMAILAIINLGDEKALATLEYAHKTEMDPDIKDVVEKLLIKFGKIKKKQ